jgi:hypothetical protein
MRREGLGGAAWLALLVLRLSESVITRGLEEPPEGEGGGLAVLGGGGADTGGTNMRRGELRPGAESSFCLRCQDSTSFLYCACPSSDSVSQMMRQLP